MGAPKENVTGSDGTEIGGAVYKCNATSTSPDDCIRLTGLLLGNLLSASIMFYSFTIVFTL